MNKLLLFLLLLSPLAKAEGEGISALTGMLTSLVGLHKVSDIALDGNSKEALKLLRNKHVILPVATSIAALHVRDILQEKQCAEKAYKFQHLGCFAAGYSILPITALTMYGLGKGISKSVEKYKEIKKAIKDTSPAKMMNPLLKTITKVTKFGAYSAIGLGVAHCLYTHRPKEAQKPTRTYEYIIRKPANEIPVVRFPKDAKF
jgi:hypothetical protein